MRCQDARTVYRHAGLSTGRKPGQSVCNLCSTDHPGQGDNTKSDIGELVHDVFSDAVLHFFVPLVLVASMDDIIFTD